MDIRQFTDSRKVPGRFISYRKRLIRKLEKWETLIKYVTIKNGYSQDQMLEYLTSVSDTIVNKNFKNRDKDFVNHIDKGLLVPQVKSMIVDICKYVLGYDNEMTESVIIDVTKTGTYSTLRF